MASFLNRDPDIGHRTLINNTQVPTNLVRKAPTNPVPKAPTNLVLNPPTNLFLNAVDAGDPSLGNVVDMLFWISHGVDIGNSQTHYEVDTPFSAINFYSEPTSKIYTELLDAIVGKNSNAILKLVTGVCPKVPIKRCNSPESYVLLPPLLFKEHDVLRQPNEGDQKLVDYIGLYYFKIQYSEQKQKIQKSFLDKSTGDNYHITGKCKIIYVEQILSNTGIGKLRDEKKARGLTYADIQELGEKYCVAKQLSTKDVLLGIYSCQEPSMSQFNLRGGTEIFDSINPKAGKKLKNADIVAEVSDIESIDVFYVHHAGVLQDTCSSIANTLSSQFCALNILSYYGVITETTSHETSTCLPQTGISIFKIIDYIDRYISFNMKNTDMKVENNKYVVIRFEIAYGITNVLALILRTIQTKRNFFIAFNLYKRAGENGHTASVFVDDNGLLYYRDPAPDCANIKIENENALSQMATILKRNYESISFIFTVKSEGQTTPGQEIIKNKYYERLKDFIKQGIEQGKGEIMQRPDRDVKRGGVKKSGAKKNGGVKKNSAKKTGAKKTSRLFLRNKKTQRK
jgi:hypothetical protein